MNILNNLPSLALLDIPHGYLNIMGYVDESEVNGPGCRAVVWVQGCHRACPGCFNPDSWSFAINQFMVVETLIQKILSNPRNQGVTFSEGEPFWQAPALTELACQVKAAGLNVMSFTGFTLDQLRADSAPTSAQDLLNQLDILIDGPYVEALKIHSPDSPVASSNQQVHIFNPAFKDKITWASDQLEIHVQPDGSRTFTGYHSQLIGS
ncbi:MAG: radical SAM protein [Acaryochloris sp. RU_4_1]|nr:radical SAM protein [Acaryochloris sp. RU_4_1]